MPIIAAVDRSDRTTKVIEQARDLAEAFNSSLYIVHVLTESEFVDLERTSIDETGDVVEMDQIRGLAEEIAADTAPDLNVPHEFVGLVGDPAERIVEYADEQNAQYIVVSGRNRSPTGKVVFGSVSQSILLNAKCPVVSAIEL